jgi:alkanesulfonate monooxygenase SsuD/methylene tetrahydromethanopterin reductase-like flavin-dependent oxidoreductase (luciferase family)
VRSRSGAQAQVYEEYFFPLLKFGNQLPLLKPDPSMPDEPDEAVAVDWLMDNTWLVGSPDEVAHKLRALHSEVGGFGEVLQLVYDWGDQQDKSYRSMELLATRVLPQLADLM